MCKRKIKKYFGIDIDEGNVSGKTQVHMINYIGLKAGVINTIIDVGN